MLVSPRITLGSYELIKFPSMAPPDIPPPASWKWKIPVAPRSPNKTTKAMSVEAPGGWVDDVHRKTLKHENVWKDFLLVYMAHMVTYDKFSGSFFHDKFHRLCWRLLWNYVNVSIMVVGCKLYCGMGWVLLRFFFGMRCLVAYSFEMKSFTLISRFWRSWICISSCWQSTEICMSRTDGSFAHQVDSKIL